MSTSASEARGRSRRAARLLPVAGAIAAVVVLLIGLFVAFGDALDTLSAPPAQALSIERVRLPGPNTIELTVVNDGPEPVEIAQVRVDDAYWEHRVEPSRTVPRLGSATVTIPYPWVYGEAHHISLISNLGVTFDETIDVAVKSPEPSASLFAKFTLVGVYVGVVPVLLGVLLFPLLRRFGSQGIGFLLSLTIGLLIFLAIDTWLDAVEFAQELPAFWQGIPMTLFVALLTVAVLLGISGVRAGRSVNPLVTAYIIAIGIGFHNLGEGLAIGSAYALGQAALGRFLILGFAVHNVTEGIGIAAPLLGRAPRIRHFTALVLIAGAPAIFGTWLGGFAFDPVLATVFLAIGLGAILEVIWSVGRLLASRGERSLSTLATPLHLAGIFTGIVVMYATGLLVKL